MSQGEARGGRRYFDIGDQSLITARVAKIWEGVANEVLPLQKGGTEEVLAMLKF